MSNTKKEWISNWLISNSSPSNNEDEKRFHHYNNSETPTPIEQHQQKVTAAAATESELIIQKCFSNSKIHKKTSNNKSKALLKNKSLTKLIEDSELTVSPVSGTFIIKEWNSQLKNKIVRQQEQKSSAASKSSSKKASGEKFTNDEVLLNSVASNYVQITDEAKMKLSKIVNCIGPYECKLCKVVYEDAFELAMHNCPRVVHFEYRCSECNKVFNCPANLASHKRWHKPKGELNTENAMEVVDTSPIEQTQTSTSKQDSNETKSSIFEKLPQIIEERQKSNEKTKLSTTNTPQPQYFYNNGSSTLNYDNNTPATYGGYYNNNSSSEWLSEMYRNYFTAAAVYLQTKQFSTSSTATSTTATTTTANLVNPTITNASMLFNQQIPPITDIHETNRHHPLFTCKYCYSTFSDNFSLIFHIRKAHSSILLNFN